MPPKTIQVDHLRLEPVLDARADELAGFFVRGLKRKRGSAKRQVGFLLSNIRLVTIKPPEKIRFRVLLTFLSTGFTVQEDFYSWKRRPGKNSAFLVNFENWRPFILEGAPQLDDTQCEFHNQWVELKWSDQGIVIIPTPQPAHFSALLDPKHHKIELTVQSLKGKRAQ
ncbi:MAG: hypothetical protein ACFFCZ_29280 [Promethearchaeota archaeon]